MNTCPVCSRPMPLTLHWKTTPRRFCSRRCVLRAHPPGARNTCLDEMAVVRLIAGDRIDSTKAERLEAVRALTARGRSASWIAEHLRVTKRSVTRYRAELHTNRKDAA